MVAGAFIAQGALDHHVVGRLADGAKLAGRRHADEHLAARRESLFRAQHRKRSPDRMPDHADARRPAIPFPHAGVEASPIAGRRGAEFGSRVFDEVAVRIEDADRGHRPGSQVHLTAHFANGGFRPKHRSFAEIVAFQQGNVRVGGTHDFHPRASIDVRAKVARMRVPARTLPRNEPATLDSPPVRQRQTTGTSRMRRRARAAFICISRFQP